MPFAEILPKGPASKLAGGSHASGPVTEGVVSGAGAAAAGSAGAVGAAAAGAGAVCAPAAMAVASAAAPKDWRMILFSLLDIDTIPPEHDLDMNRMSFYVRCEVVDSISRVRTTFQSGQEKSQGDCVCQEKIVKSCAFSAAPFGVLNRCCGLTLVTQTMHKEQMRITERNQMEAWGLRLQGADGPQATLLYGAAQWFLLPFAR
jgi:hypothetical protein